MQREIQDGLCWRQQLNSNRNVAPPRAPSSFQSSASSDSAEKMAEQCPSRHGIAAILFLSPSRSVRQMASGTSCERIEFENAQESPRHHDGRTKKTEAFESNVLCQTQRQFQGFIEPKHGTAETQLEQSEGRHIVHFENRRSSNIICRQRPGNCRRIQPCQILRRHRPRV